MHIQLTTWRVSAGHTQRPGTVLDLPDREAKALIKAGSADLVPSIETATLAPPETAAIPRPQPRRNKR
jgi:hypothetical protein